MKISQSDSFRREEFSTVSQYRIVPHKMWDAVETKLQIKAREPANRASEKESFECAKLYHCWMICTAYFWGEAQESEMNQI